MNKYYFLFLYVFLIPFQMSAQTELEGTWEGKFEGDYMKTDVIWKFSERTYALDMGSDGSIEVSGKLETEGDHLFLWDTGGPMGCPEAQRGDYTFILNGNTLKLTLVEDDCPGRNMMTPNIEWTRKK